MTRCSFVLKGWDALAQTSRARRTRLSDETRFQATWTQTDAAVRDLCLRQAGLAALGMIINAQQRLEFIEAVEGGYFVGFG